MGGGTNYGKNVRKAESFDVLGAVRALRPKEAGSGGGISDAAEFCARTHTLLFRVGRNVPLPEPGTEVRLARKGDQLAVRTGSRELGKVVGPAKDALIACLHVGFELNGEVDAVDRQERTGRVTVEGRRAKAA